LQIDSEPLGLHCARDDYHWSVPHYGVRDGRIFCDQIVVFPYLDDVAPGDGGLLVVPGSHKAEFDRPADAFGATEFETVDDLPAGIINVTPRAGDVAIISERLTHGTLRWQPTDRLRRVLVLRYQPQFHPGGGSLPESVLSRLDPDTLELTERAGYRDVKQLVVDRGGVPAG
jgi:ectoine hydroxylase-related dioxygenase (phytanoyl-CoA dioxygenase family)